MALPQTRNEATQVAFTSDDQRWEAVKRRDGTADNAFVCCVRTTGVYCRPSCAARLPRRENVSFRATCADAERAGFRPCKRCRPDQVSLAERQARVIAGACRLIERAEEPTQARSAVPTPSTSVKDRLAALDWRQLAEDLDAHGCAVVGNVLTDDDCVALAESYSEEAPFRSRIVMERHGFGRGEYKYFAYPLPHIVAALRVSLYPPLAEIANRWNATMGVSTRYPAAHADFLERCHAEGQTKPTPLLLQYGEGDYNSLHQDLYGEHVFPLQVAFLLSEPGRDFTGGELVLTEQRPRMQSRAEVVPLRQGDGIVFPVHYRPVQGARDAYRVNMRHGVSRIRSGRRHTLGVIFHDAR